MSGQGTTTCTPALKGNERETFSSSVTSATVYLAASLIHPPRLRPCADVAVFGSIASFPGSTAQLSLRT